MSGILHLTMLLSLLILQFLKRTFKPKKCTIVKDSEDKINFINKLIKAIKNINTNNIYNKDDLENIV